MSWTIGSCGASQGPKIARKKTNPTRAPPTRTFVLRASARRAPRSAIELARDHVDRSEPGDGVGEHLPADHVRKGRVVGEARRAHADAVRFRAAVRHDVVAELAVSPLGRAVEVALRRVDAVHDE